MKKIIFFALLIRLTLAPFFYHGDTVQYYFWSKDIWNNGFLRFYDRDIANAMRPTYPPVTSYIFFITAGFHTLLWHVFWLINLLIPYFPSNLIFWLESEQGWVLINKLPAIVSDALIIYILYLFSKKLNTTNNKSLDFLPSIYFGFLPPFIYSSSVWGQTDSIYIFFIILAFYLLVLKNYFLSPLSYLFAVLTKPTAFFVLPVFFIYWFINAGMKKIIPFLFMGLFLTLLLYFPFHPENLPIWLINFYQSSLGGELGYLVANAFNIWGLLFGFDNRPETTLVFGISAKLIGPLLFSLISLTILYMTFITKNKHNIKIILISSSLVAFTAFLFLPRMHERYFYPVLIVLLPLIGIDKQIRRLVLGLSLVHFINLYHFFWVPRIEILVYLFSNQIVEQIIIVVNICLYIGLFLLFKRRLRYK